MTDRPVRISDLQARKLRGEKIAMLTAYDATMAGLSVAIFFVVLIGQELLALVRGRATRVARS